MLTTAIAWGLMVVACGRAPDRGGGMALVRIEHRGLRLAHPAGWGFAPSIPRAPARVLDDGAAPHGWSKAPADRPTSGLAASIAPVQSAGLPPVYSVLGPRHGSAAIGIDSVETIETIEIGVLRRPGYANLSAALALERRLRHGAHRLLSSRVVTIAGREWLHSELELADRAAVELSTVRSGTLFVVTLRGRQPALSRLASTVGPTLALTGNAEKLSPPVPPASPEPPVRAAASATVLLMAGNAAGGRLELLAGGSGSIVAADGTVLTCAHLLYESDAGRVPGRLYDAFVIGLVRGLDDPPELVCAGRPRDGLIEQELDLAMIRCDRDLDGRPWQPGPSSADWPAVPMGAAAELDPGQPIAVLGFPEQTGGLLAMTRGQITSNGPALQAAAGIQGYGAAALANPHGYLETSAVISPGTSGGAAVNLRGELIGVATAFRWRAEASSRNGAVTVDRVERVGLIRPIEHAASLLEKTTARQVEHWRSGSKHPAPPP